MANTESPIYSMPFAAVYPHYIAKAEKKGKTKAQVHQLINWLTGYSDDGIQLALEDERSFEQFFAQAPKLNPLRRKITGVICGVRVKDIQEPLMQEIRYLDKLIDELARGKKFENILRS